MFLKAGFILVALSVLVGEFTRQFRIRRDQALRDLPGPLGLTGAELARKVLDLAGITGVEIEPSEALITDTYDPAKHVLRLSPQNFHGTNTAALGTALHVSGHVLQAEAGYRPLQWRLTAIRLTTFGTPISFLVALPLLFFQFRFGILLLGLMWAFIRINNLLTLPVEIDASARAKDLLREKRVLRLGRDLDSLESMMRAAELDRVSGFLHFWSYIFSRIFPWKKSPRSPP